MTSSDESSVDKSVKDIVLQESQLESDWPRNDLEDEEFINEYMRPVTVTVSDGNAFKTVIGDQPMTPGGRYFFEMRVNSGYLLKIGVCRKTINVDKVGPSLSFWHLWHHQLQLLKA